MQKIKSLFSKILNNKIFISFIMSSLTYLSICRLDIIKSYNEISWFMYIVLFLLYSKTDIYNKKYKKDIIILSIIFTVISIFGKFLYTYKYDNSIDIFKKVVTITKLIYSFGIFNLIYILMINIFPKLMDFKIKTEKKLTLKPIHVFIICLIFILIGWLPYFLRYYPGTLSPDSLNELSIVINNFTVVTDHHPVLHVLFIALPYSIGFKIFGTVKAGVVCYTIYQMIIMASIFSSLIVFLYNRKVNKIILIIIMLFYSLVPIFGYYSIVMWKDVIFAGAVLLLSMETIRIIERYDNLKIKDFIIFTILSLLCVFFRNNGIYMYIIFSIFTIILLKKKYKVFLVPIIIVFSVYLIVKGPVFNALNITKSASSEYIGMPLQQVGRMAYKNVKFTKEEKNKINKLIPIEELKKCYNPVISDDIKFNEYYNIKEFDDNKLEYLKLWLQLVFKHPKIALEAYTISTLGYWYPGVEYWSNFKYIMENDVDLKIEPKVNKFIQKNMDRIDSRNIPILNIQWSIGICMWIILIFGYICVRRKGIKYLYPYIPVFGVWVTMMVASPVFAEFRYIYGAYTCLPLLVVLPYIKEKVIK